jgi:O-acetyl-ADP-ribose deacetylase (regulator of RNase III)
MSSVNCKGVMGSGLALDIKNKWPEVFSSYIRAYHQDKLKLGKTWIVNVGPNLYIANLVGQKDYGRIPGRVYTHYNALEECFSKLKNISTRRQVYIPYNIGCGSGGGKWRLVYEMIKRILPNAIICKKPENDEKFIDTIVEEEFEMFEFIDRLKRR